MKLQLGTVLSVNDNDITASYDGENRVLHGLGGSPVVNFNGEVIGIAYAFVDGAHVIARIKP